MLANLPMLINDLWQIMLTIWEKLLSKEASVTSVTFLVFISVSKFIFESNFTKTMCL